MRRHWILSGGLLFTLLLGSCGGFSTVKVTSQDPKNLTAELQKNDHHLAKGDIIELYSYRTREVMSHTEHGGAMLVDLNMIAKGVVLSVLSKDKIKVQLDRKIFAAQDIKIKKRKIRE